MLCLTTAGFKRCFIFTFCVTPPDFHIINTSHVLVNMWVLVIILLCLLPDLRGWKGFLAFDWKWSIKRIGNGSFCWCARLILSGGIATKPSVFLRQFVGGKHPEASIGSFHLFHGDSTSTSPCGKFCSWTGKRRGFGDLSACSNYLCKWWLYQNGSKPDS